MTTVSTIISDAFREGNLIAAGGSVTTTEETEGLRLLNRVVLGLFGTEMGEPLSSLPLGLDNIETPDLVSPRMDDFLNYYVPSNTRLYCNLTEATAVNLNPDPRPGARLAVVDNGNDFDVYNLTIDGNGRQIEAANTLTLNTAGTDKQWFYREDLGNWARLTDLLTTDDSPFPGEFDDLLILGLAVRLAPRHGFAISQESGARYQDTLKKFKSRYRQVEEVGSELGLLRTPSNKRMTYGTTADFLRGINRW